MRQDIYRLLDETLATGRPIEIKRKGRLLRVVREPNTDSKLARLVRHPCIKGDAEALVHVNWTKEWNKGRGLS